MDPASAQVRAWPRFEPLFSGQRTVLNRSAWADGDSRTRPKVELPTAMWAEGMKALPEESKRGCRLELDLPARVETLFRSMADGSVN